MKRHLVTSGCSFSDNCNERWPHYLAKTLNANLYNRGQGSCGNDWISKSAIYNTQVLLDQGISSKRITVAVMWSGIDRKSVFISNNETPDFKNLINNGTPNPINFINELLNQTQLDSNLVDGYLVGSANCGFTNNKITTFKKEVIKKYTDESLAIESYENFLRLQWFCKSNNIKLINQTYRDIMHYPKYAQGPLTKDYYRNVTHLHNMIDFSNWIFWNKTGGLYEYTLDNQLEFYPDKLHPLPSSHKHYVDNYLITEIQTRNFI